jgi:hypothetical protein
MGILREPLLHFLAVGALLFVGYARVNRHAAAPDEIRVTRGHIEHLAGTFERTWQRPPTAAELQGLVEGWIRDEVFYREGVALGLDRGDTVVRSRVRQKMEVLVDDAAAGTPSDAELQAWLDAHRDDYTIPPAFTFQQVYLDPARHPALADDVFALMSRLKAGADPGAAGDATLLPAAMHTATIPEIERTFGPALAGALAKLEVGAWYGPVRSSYGAHLVRVTARRDARIPALAEVRDAVARDLVRARTKDAQDAYYGALRERYRIVVEPLDVARATPDTDAR